MGAVGSGATALMVGLVGGWGSRNGERRSEEREDGSEERERGRE